MDEQPISFDFEPILGLWLHDDQEPFNDALLEFLSEKEIEGKLPLDAFCEAGGGPDWEDNAEFHLTDTSETQSDLIAEVTVYFNESVPTGCRDMNFTEPRHGLLVITINKETEKGEIEFLKDYDRYNPENY